MSNIPSQSPQSTDALPDGTHDFEFLHGTWSVRNRRLKEILAGSNEWYEFAGTTTERPLWDGQANIEEYDGHSPSGRVRGLALRIYNPHSRQWSIYWSNSAYGTLDVPVVGDFRTGRGEFYAHDTFEGRPIMIRFFWTPISADSCQWEQAFSADGGKSWETNWIMEFTRDE